MFIIRGTPSTTTSGWFEPLIDLLPRKSIFDDPPAPVEFGVICRPAALPCSALIILTDLMSATSSPPTVSAA